MVFRLADQSHEQALRTLTQDNAMPGWIELTYGREPNFFHGLDVVGKINQVILALDEGGPVGMGCRSIKRLFVNGCPRDLGYLSGLRSLEHVRRNIWLARGYQFLHQLHADGITPAYLTTILDSNSDAKAIVTSKRAGLPHYLPYGRYICYAVNLNCKRRPLARSIEIRRGDDRNIEEMVDFINNTGPAKQFFPVLSASDLGSSYLRGLRPQDFRIAFSGNSHIIGVMAAWDQKSFKQNIVKNYSIPVRLFRPVINQTLRLAGFHPLPAPGEQINSVYLAFACVRNNDPEIARALIERIYMENRWRDCHFLLIGFHENDPLKRVMRHYTTFRYISQFYLVCWEDGLDFVRNLDSSRIPHLELATL